MSKPGDPTMPSASDQRANEVHAEEAYCSACNQSFPSGTKTCPNDGARLITLAAERDELIGKVLDERYEIRAPLGKGGMGTVYRGWQLSVDREVAIKVIHPRLSNDRSAVKRFLREARLASRLSQPNIVNVFDFGQSDGVLYLVMELLRGHMLGNELGPARRLNTKRTVVIASQLCDALEAAHAQGIVHRDLKPSNIVLLDDPPGRDLIKVLDFGLAKSLIQDSGSIVTNTDALLGTPLYMAPEQIEGKVSDQRSDLYSLGCILFEMLTGRPPFVDSAVSAVLARHINDEPAPLPSHVPAKLRTLIEQLLAKTPEGRVQSAGEVRRVLDDIRDTPGMLHAPPPAFVTNDTAPADTIPDTSVALAETHAATPTPAGMVVRVTPAASTGAPLGVSIGASRERSFQAQQAQPAALRRYGWVAGLVIVSLAVVVVMFVMTKRGGSPASRGADRPQSGSATVHDVGSSGGVPGSATQGAIEGSAPVALMDAGVETVAIPPTDAGVRASTKPSRPRPPTTRPPATPAETTPVQPKPTPTRPDAGAPELPDIDFLKSKSR